MTKIAVILFNLGGPDRKSAVQPFLFNLFNDPAILRLPSIVRFFLAKLISWRRAPVAHKIYDQIGGQSPILYNTQMQATKLEEILNQTPSQTVFKCFIAMRYWHPFYDETAPEVKKFAPDEIILLPLYPQFSTTTTRSSFDDWRKISVRSGLTIPTRAICCYPQERGFITALAGAIKLAYAAASQFGKPRVLLSAHGLPERIVKAGDPYQIQCGLTAESLCQELKIENLDVILCFQSRVGPLKWIGPSTDDEVRRAGADKVPIVIAPIAFVSDHSETLVEIDIEYRHLAQQHGVPFFSFVPAVGVTRDFVAGLAAMVQDSMTKNKDCLSNVGKRICPREFHSCPCR